MSTEPLSLRTVLGTYPLSQPLKSGAISAPDVTLAFEEVKPTHKAFKPIVRQQAYDVCELAIVTYLQAKAFGKPLILLPAVVIGRFQHHCILYNTERGTVRPEDLAGRRVGVRSYTQTTGVWLRGLLENDYGVPSDRIHWVTFEDAHVAEYRDPPDVERASADKDMTAMLLAGEIDAAIYGTELPDDPRLQPVIANPHAAAQQWHAKHKLVPINHMVVMTEQVARAHPRAVRSVYDLLLRAKQALPPTVPDPNPLGMDAVRPALEMMVDYAVQQQLIPRRFTVEELFAGTTRAIAA
jgi:4,5-dihydroxyphthalate decarboxylase